jgi:hypothetical protein
MDKSKKVYVTVTRDRLFVSQNLDKNQWLLVDKRGNVYENLCSVNDIIKHIDKFVEQGKYVLK